MTEPCKPLFLVASARQPGVLGNTEQLAQLAAHSLPSHAAPTWHHLAHMALPMFQDLRHDVGHYPMPEGDLRVLLNATMSATDIVWVMPVYWYSFPNCLKNYIDHWSAWMRVEGLPFKAEMAKKTLHLIVTSGDRATAQSAIDSAWLCAKFLNMRQGGLLWGKGGPPQAVLNDTRANAQATHFFANFTDTHVLLDE